MRGYDEAREALIELREGLRGDMAEHDMAPSEAYEATRDYFLSELRTGPRIHRVQALAVVLELASAAVIEGAESGG